MDFKDRAKVAAVLDGWMVNEDGDFVRILESGEPDVVTNVGPGEPCGWIDLCDIEGIEVPDHFDQESLDRANTAIAAFEVAMGGPMLSR